MFCQTGAASNPGCIAASIARGYALQQSWWPAVGAATWMAVDFLTCTGDESTGGGGSAAYLFGRFARHGASEFLQASRHIHVGVSMGQRLSRP